MEPTGGTEARCAREIEELHAFFTRWFNGELEREPSAFARFEDVLGEGFVMIGIEGGRTERDALVEAIWEDWNHPADEGRRIEIETEDVHLVRSEGELHLVNYLEHQREGGDSNTRRTTVLFRETSDAPNGLVWLYVHETPLST